MPISSGAKGVRVASRPPSSAQSTPNLAQPPPPGRMIDAPPKVETRRRQLGASQTSLYGSRPPWATEEDSPAPQPQPPPQPPQPPFYPAGSDLPHGEASRMRRMKAARQLYKSPQSRRQHTGSVDDLLKDCAISDHSHSPSPVRRAPSVASSLARSTPDLQQQPPQRPNTRNAGVGTDDDDVSGGDFNRSSRRRRSGRSVPDLRGSERRHRRREVDDDGSVSGDSLEDRDRTDASGIAGRRRGRPKSRATHGTSPPPQPPPPMLKTSSTSSRSVFRPSQPLYVDTECNPEEPARGGFGRSKMAPGLKPASEKRYVPPPPPQAKQPPPTLADASNSPTARRQHDCFPGHNPPFRARPMPDFKRASPLLPVRPQQPRSRSQSPARGATAPEAAAAAEDAVAPTQPVGVRSSGGGTSGYRSGGSSSPQRRQRRRSMDEDSLTEASSFARGIEDRSVETEVVQLQRSSAADRQAIAADAVDSALRNLGKPSNSVPQGPQLLQVLVPDAAAANSFNSQLASLLSDESGWQYSSDLPQSLVDANQSEAGSCSSQPIGGEPGKPANNASPERLEASWATQQPQGQWILPNWCHLCQKKVYPLEMLAWNDRAFHKSCIKCHVCRKQLSIGNFAVLGDHMYCPSHYLELVKQSGAESTESDQSSVTVNGSEAAAEVGCEFPHATEAADPQADAANHKTGDRRHGQSAVSRAALQLRRVESYGGDGGGVPSLVVSGPAQSPEQLRTAAQAQTPGRPPGAAPVGTARSSFRRVEVGDPGSANRGDEDSEQLYAGATATCVPGSCGPSPWKVQNQHLQTQPLQNQQLQNQQLQNQPLQNQQLQNQPQQNQRIQNQSLQSQPLQNQPLQSQRIQNQLLQNQLVQNQSFQNQPLQNQPLQSQRIQNRPQQNQPLQNQHSQIQPQQRQNIESLQEPKRATVEPLEPTATLRGFTAPHDADFTYAAPAFATGTDNRIGSYSGSSTSHSPSNSQLAMRIRQLEEQQQSFRGLRLPRRQSPVGAQGDDSPSEASPARPANVARESDVLDVRPERGSTRSLLSLWREREAAAARPLPPRRDRTDKSESELPSSGAARSALRLWRDKEAELAGGRAWTGINYAN